MENEHPEGQNEVATEPTADSTSQQSQRVINDFVITPKPPVEQSQFNSENSVSSSRPTNDITGIDDEAAAFPATPVQASATSHQAPHESISVMGDKPIKQGPNKKLLAIGIILLLLALGAAAWFILIKDKKSTTATTAVAKTAVVEKKEIPLIRSYSAESIDTSVFPPTYASSNIVIEIRRQMFEPLVTFVGITNIEPLLATSWTNPDTNTWVFKLKSGVKFHNGSDLTATEVKGSIDAAIAIKEYEPFVSTIKSVDVVDSSTVKISTKSPDGALLNKLTYLSIYDTKVKGEIDSAAGTGPYELKLGTKPTTTFAQITAIGNYHGGKVLTKAVDFTEQTDPEKIKDAIIKGEGDIGVSMTSAQIKQILAAVPGSVATKGSSLGTFGLYLNSVKAGPLQKLDVRKAIYLALDVKKLVEVSGVPGTVGDQLVPSLVPGYNPNIKPPVRDVAAAKKLLADAGYPKGFILDIVRFKSAEALCNELKVQLAEIGITVNPVEGVSGTFFGDAQAGKLTSWLAAYATDINDSSDVITAVYQNVSYKNYYFNKNLDPIMKNVNSTFDTAQRIKYLQDASKLIMDDVPFVPLRNREYVVVSAKPYIYTVDTGLSPVLGVNYWKVYLK